MYLHSLATYCYTFKNKVQLGKMDNADKNYWPKSRLIAGGRTLGPIISGYLIVYDIYNFVSTTLKITLITDISYIVK